jgi:hypothetical protein
LIRKEHVDVAMEFMEFSRCARARDARPTRRPHPHLGVPVLQSSTACGRPSRGPTRETRSTLF